jgi:acetyltransferase
MQLLIQYARSEGLKSLFGEVLSENANMLNMCRGLGFDVKNDPDELGVARVSLDLSAAACIDLAAS